MIEPPLDPPDSYWDDEPEELMEPDFDVPEPGDHRTHSEIERDAARCEDEREAQLERYYRRLEKDGESCSRRARGKGMSEEGERMRGEALRIRSVVLKEFPEVKVAFSIKEEAS